MSRRLVVSAVGVALMCAAGVGVAVHGATGFAESDPDVCLKHPRRVMVGHGQSPGGQKWYIAGHLRNDARCTRVCWKSPSTRSAIWCRLGRRLRRSRRRQSLLHLRHCLTAT
jgi:hypothetical protein